MNHKLLVLLPLIAIASASLTACGGTALFAAPTSTPTATLMPTLTLTPTPTQTSTPTVRPSLTSSPSPTPVVCRIVSVIFVPGSDTRVRAFDFEIDGFRSREKVNASLNGPTMVIGGVSYDLPLEKQFIVDEHGQGKGSIEFGNITLTIRGEVVIPHDLIFAAKGVSSHCEVTQAVTW